MGKATIYRTLNLMVEAELARELDFGEGFKRYEPQAGEARHDHLVCTSCGTVVRFSRGPLSDMIEEIAAAEGFEPQSRRLEIYGLCAECRTESDRDEDVGGTAVAAGEGRDTHAGVGGH